MGDSCTVNVVVSGDSGGERFVSNTPMVYVPLLGITNVVLSDTVVGKLDWNTTSLSEETIARPKLKLPESLTKDNCNCSLASAVNAKPKIPCVLGVMIPTLRASGCNE